MTSLVVMQEISLKLKVSELDSGTFCASKFKASIFDIVAGGWGARFVK